MKAIEFEAQLNPDNTLTVPPTVAQKIKGENSLRVVLLIPNAAEDRSWAAMTTEQFLAGYSESDAIYDQLSAR